jgi:hypothetical protein
MLEAEVAVTTLEKEAHLPEEREAADKLQILQEQMDLVAAEAVEIIAQMPERQEEMEKYL